MTQKLCAVGMRNAILRNHLNAGVLSQSASSNHVLLIKKKINALCPSQSVASNFAQHVLIIVKNYNHNYNDNNNNNNNNR